MNCTGRFFRCFWPVIFVFIALYLLTLYTRWHPIEQDVATNAASALQGQGIEWANVDTFNRGRDVLLTGTAPNEVAVKQAKQAVLQAEGVRVVDFAGDIASDIPTVTLKDASVGVRFESGKVILNGMVANQAEVDRLVAQAAGLYGAENISNQLVIEDGVKPFAINGLFSALNGLSDGDAVEFDGMNINLLGKVESFGLKNTIAKALAQLFPDKKINNQLALIVQEVLPDQIVDKAECQALFVELLESSKVYFETAQSAIKSDSYVLLDKLAFSVRRCPDALVEVSGHTDADGDDDTNLALSQKRADAVVNYLVNSGVLSEQLSAVGYGETQPVADNETAAGKAQNRRIEFTVKN